MPRNGLVEFRVGLRSRAMYRTFEAGNSTMTFEPASVKIADLFLILKSPQWNCEPSMSATSIPLVPRSRSLLI